MITKDALEFLRAQAIAASSPVQRVAGEPEDHYLLRRASGEWERVQAERSPRRYHAATIESFVKLLNTLRQRIVLGWGEQIFGATDPPGEPVKRSTLGAPLVMVGKSQVVGLLDESSRREWIIFPLTVTRAYQTLIKCEMSRCPCDQEAFVRLLRVDLNGCMSREIIATFRALKFIKNNEGESSVDNSKKAISQKVQMSLAAGGKAIPDEVTIRVPIFEEFAQDCPDVICAIETNVEEGRFTLIPLAGELSQADRFVRNEIAAKLRTAWGGVVDVELGEVNW